MNERFKWTIAKGENEQNRQKKNDNFKNKLNNFFWNDWMKRMRCIVYEPQVLWISYIIQGVSIIL